MKDLVRWTESETTGKMEALCETNEMIDGVFSVIIRDYGFRQTVSVAINDNDGWCDKSMFADDLIAFNRNIPFFTKELGR